MIVVAYILLLCALGVAVWPRRKAGWGDAWSPLRITALAASIVCVGLGVILIVSGAAEPGEPRDWEIWPVAGAFLAGSALSGAGIAVRQGRKAGILRGVGFLLMLGAFAVPSTLTLLSPVLILLAAAGPGRGRWHATPAPPRSRPPERAQASQADGPGARTIRWQG